MQNTKHAKCIIQKMQNTKNAIQNIKYAGARPAWSISGLHSPLSPRCHPHEHTKVRFEHHIVIISMNIGTL